MASHPQQEGAALSSLIFLILVPLAAGFAAVQWYVSSLRYVTTDNAYVKSDIIAISASIGGRVTSVSVTDNRSVSRGEVLFELDRRAYQAALDRAHARLTLIRNEIASMHAHYRQIEAEITDAEERVVYLQRQRKREQELEDRGMNTQAKIDQAAYRVVEATQRVRALKQTAQQVLAELGGDIGIAPEQHPKYLEALAERDEAQLDFEHTVVRAPADGTVSRMKLQAGEWVQAGTPVFSLIQRGGLWIEANLKETQLTHVQEGQPVTFVADSYPDVEWRGHVASISSATGSEFLLLPPQNATGNWVKVVQRVPVRVEIESGQDGPPLRAGMTVHFSLDTGRDARLLSVVENAVASMRGQ